MTCWNVRSGDLDVQAMGATPFDAVVNAIKEHQPKALGVIAVVSSEEYYVSIERACRAALMPIASQDTASPASQETTEP
jgi:hypothetical protein